MIFLSKYNVSISNEVFFFYLERYKWIVNGIIYKNDCMFYIILIYVVFSLEFIFLGL